MILSLIYIFYVWLFVILNYAGISLYFLDTTEFLFINYSCSKFAKLCIACNVKADCILKGLEAVSSCFVYEYTHLLAAQ